MENVEEKHEDQANKRSFTIIVNGKRKEFGEKEISFVEVVELAFGTFEDNPLIVYTVTYKYPNGRSGSMVQGDKIKVRNKMIFNVTRTDKS